MNTIAVILLFVVGTAGQDEAARLVRDLSDESPERRDAAVKGLLAGWDRWTDADLARLDRFARGTDLEAVTRARAILKRIRFRRQIGTKVLARLPDVEIGALGDSDRSLVRALYQAAKELKDGRLEPPDVARLVEAVVEARPKLTHDDAIEDLAELPRKHRDPVWLPLLGLVLRHAEEEARLEGLRTLEALGTPRALRLVLPLFDDKSPAVRERAVRIVAEIGNEGLVPKLAERLKDPDSKVRAAALAALGRFRSKGFASEALKLLKDPRSWISIEGARILADMGAREHADTILPLLKHRDGQARRGAAKALARLGTIEHADKIAELLGHHNYVVRYVAAQSLRLLDAREYIPQVARLLEGKNDSELHQVTSVLGEWGAREQASRIVPLLQNEGQAVRFTAAQTLGWFRAAEHEEAVASLLEDPNLHVRAAALVALCRIGGKRRLSDALARLREGEPYWAAANGIAEIGVENLSPRERADLIDRLRVFEVRLEKRMSDKRSIWGLQIRLGAKNGAEQVRIAGRADREYGSRPILDGLAWAHERETFWKVRREFAASRTITSIADTKAVFEERSLKLEVGRGYRFEGRVALGSMTTLRKLLDHIVTPQPRPHEAVPEGIRVLWVPIKQASQLWVSRLKE